MRLSLFGRVDDWLAPAPAPRRVEALKALPFAHRGLHGPDRPENSRAAFRAALDAGHGIELDVRLSRDGHAMVFHDAELGRLTGEHGALAERSAAELAGIALKGGAGETIPSLPEVLALIAGRAPLLIELKAPDARVAPLCLSVFPRAGRLSRPGRRHVVQSGGGPLVRPGTGRGSRAAWSSPRRAGGRRGAWKRRLALYRARPDFLAYDVRDLPSRFAADARRRGLPVFTWTCRSAEDEARAKANADQPIHEYAERVWNGAAR
jgi:glycerophosphoryl diester phosphodiesterase